MTFPHCFITGTDTDAGKTMVSASLLRCLAAQGRSVAGVKPLASGFVETAAGWFNSDIESLKAAGSYDLPKELINQYAYRPFIAPHIAAKHLGEEINLDLVVASVAKAKRQVDTLVVEGVGGWRVPLTVCSSSCAAPCNIHSGKSISSLSERLGLPVVLVVGLRLGCLNHALLTAEAIIADGQRLMGWVACGVDPEFEYKEDNMQTLKQLMPAPLIFEVPHLQDVVLRESYYPANLNI